MIPERKNFGNDHVRLDYRDLFRLVTFEFPFEKLFLVDPQMMTPMQVPMQQQPYPPSYDYKQQQQYAESVQTHQPQEGPSLDQFIHSEEQRNGVRFSFNLWPSNRTDSAKSIIPLGVVFTPLRPRSDLPPITYEPVLCGRAQCRATLNPFCHVDYSTKTWTCVFCMQRNGLPPSYHGMNEQNRVAELHPDYSTIVYTLPPTVTARPCAFLFVIGTCAPQSELKDILTQVEAALDKIPQTCPVGLITYGRVVQLHQIVSDHIPVSFVFEGTRDLETKRIQELLNIHPTVAAATQTTNGVTSQRFLLPLVQCERSLRERLKRIRSDPWTVPQGLRPLRVSGAALGIAVNLMEILHANNGARILMFIDGPCTHGIGMVVNEELKNPIRSHNELCKDQAKYSRKAIRYYEGLANKAASNGHSIDLFSCALDQTGLYEMKYCCNYTGGRIVLGDSFSSTLFKESFLKIFSGIQKDGSCALAEMDFGLNATIEVKTSRELKISGCIGLCISLNQSRPNVSDQEIGVGKTASWKIPLITAASSSYTFFFDVAHQQTPAADLSSGYVQFITRYQRVDGTLYVRSTTVNRNWVDGTVASNQIRSGFDQDASTVLMARIAVYRCEAEEATSSDVLRWLDRTLIRLCQTFGIYRKDNPASFSMPQNFNMFPQYVFHLRRSQFLQVFNNSPDETSFYRHCLLAETVANSIVMILPVLFAYSLTQPTTGVVVVELGVESR
ncbi:hypothetical protein ACOME3_004536 [Neoechinorhynchus agilis]